MTAEPKAENKPQVNALRPQPEVPELVAAGPDEKNWRGMGIALLVIIAVCALIATAIILLTPGDKGSRVKKSRIELDEVVNGYFSYRRFNGTWISNHEFLYQDPYGAVEIYDVLNNTNQIVISNTTLKQHGISRYFLSADRNYFLFSHKYSRVFRYTYKAAFMIYNISSDYLSPLFPDTPDLELQYAAWGPTGNQLVYVLNNNIYYMADVNSKPRQLTTDGVPGTIFNGIPDWVYEEEVLTDSHALWWSEDGKKLCFATFNDTDVDEIMYPYYGPYADVNNVYPEIVSLKYPKAGKTNPSVTLWIADLVTSQRPHVILPPKEYHDLDYYFTEAQWVNNSSVSIIWLKRAQNSSIISICKEKDGWICDKNIQEDSKGNGWVDLSSKLIFSSDRKYYFVILSGPPDGIYGRFKHVAAIDAETGEKTFLTSGKFDVIQILSYNQKMKTVYYISTLEGKPEQRHLFSVTELRSPNPKHITCITCDKNKDCLYNSAYFGPKAEYYVLECSGPGIPKLELRSTESDEYVEILDTNEDLEELVNKKALPQMKKYKVPINGNYEANVRVFLPPGLREDEITKYPMLVEVYGGPGSQMVTEKFNINWGYYLASKKNVIYTVIDGRGSGNQGDKILHELYRRLGTVEVQDQISVTKYLRDELHYIDGSKIAIFGWSYGGYVTAMSLASDDNVFKCGISVAPVTSWLYYDSVYTERYMQNPSVNDNLSNYEKSEVMKRASHFKGKRYLLVHGTADDNVHWQQSMMLAKALTDAGVIFRMQVYPDERHALSNVKLHLYQTMDNFLDICFDDSREEESLFRSYPKIPTQKDN